MEANFEFECIAAVSCGSPLVSQRPPAEALDVAKVPAEHIYTTQGSLAVRERTYTTQGSLAVRERTLTMQGSSLRGKLDYSTRGLSREELLVTQILSCEEHPGGSGV